DATSLSRALIIAKEKQLVLNDGTADRAAKLIPTTRWNHAASHCIGLVLGKRITRCGCISTAEPERAAVHVIAARLSLYRDQAGDSLSEFGVVILQRHLRLSNGVEVRVDNYDPKNRVLIIGAVKFESGAAEVLAVNKDLLATLGIFRGRMAPAHQLLRARRRQLERCKVAIEDWQVLHILRIELNRHVRAIGLQLGRFGGYLNRFRSSAHLELSVDAHGGVCLY